MKKASTETELLIKRAAAGDRSALEELFSRHRHVLVRAARRRLDPRLRARLDASDVVQQAYVDATRRFAKYLKKPAMPFAKWLLFLTVQRVKDAYRKHVKAKGRDVRRERRPEGKPRSSRPRSSGFNPVDPTTVRPPGKDSPDWAFVRSRLRKLMSRMDPASREVLELRHFNKLRNIEVAERLGISEDTAKKRHARAVQELRLLLDGQPDLLRELLG